MSIAASRACSLVLPSHPVTRRKVSASHFVAPLAGLMARYLMPCRQQYSSHTEQSRLILPAPWRASRPLVPYHVRSLASSNHSSTPPALCRARTRPMADTMDSVVRLENAFAPQSHTATPVFTPGSMPTRSFIDRTAPHRAAPDRGVPGHSMLCALHVPGRYPGRSPPQSPPA